jgi:hypothetical protein
MGFGVVRSLPRKDYRYAVLSKSPKGCPRANQKYKSENEAELKTEAKGNSRQQPTSFYTRMMKAAKLTQSPEQDPLSQKILKGSEMARRKRKPRSGM